MAIENGKLFKGILQYSAEQFKNVDKKAGYIYFVRKDTSKTEGDAEVWFGTRKYGNVEATKLADLTQRLDTAEGDITTIKGQIGEWVTNMGTIANVVSSHETRLGGHDSKILALETSLAAGGDTAKAIAAAETAAKAHADAEIAKLSEVYDAKGAAAAAEKAATDFNTAMDSRVAKLEAIDHKELMSDAINAWANQVTDDNTTVDTFKELIDYAATHSSEYSELAGVVQGLTTSKADASALTQEVTDRKAADATLKSELQGEISKKANASDLNTEVSAREALATLVGARAEGDNEDVFTKLAALVAKNGSQDEEIAKKAAQADVDALEEIVGNGFSKNSTVTSQLAEVKATADSAIKMVEAREHNENIDVDWQDAENFVSFNDEDYSISIHTCTNILDVTKEEYGDAYASARAVKTYVDNRETAIMQIVNAIDHRVYYGGDDAE